jgi:hypothetical protein
VIHVVKMPSGSTASRRRLHTVAAHVSPHFAAAPRAAHQATAAGGAADQAPEGAPKTAADEPVWYLGRRDEAPGLPADEIRHFREHGFVHMERQKKDLIICLPYNSPHNSPHNSPFK